MEFFDKLPRLEYLKLYHRIDLGLDPLPCNGHTTSLDAFWMGVPTITLASTKKVVGRAGWSQLCNLGLKEFAAQTPEQYVALAAWLSGDLPRLQELRSTLRERMLLSPLMDGKRFARHVEQAYRQMWQRWCRQATPRGAGSAITEDQHISEPGKETATTSVRQTLDAAWQHYQKGQWEQAEQLYLHVLDANPNQVDALHILAVIAGQTGRESQAIEYLRTVLRLQPGLAAAHNNLGNAFAAQGKFPDAVANFQEAVRLQPDLAVAHNNLGNALCEDGRLAEAQASLRQALLIKPDYVEAHNNLGNALREQGRLAEALASYQAALRLKPDYAEAHQNLGHIRKEQGRIDEALSSIRTAVQLKPENACFHSNLLLILNLNPHADAKDIHEESRRWNQRHALPLQKHIQPHTNDLDPERRLRIGYVSPDFREHASSSFTIPLLANHDRRVCEIFCYANVKRPDALTNRLRGYADAWRNTVGMTDQQLADLVRGDRIDILIDLAMHTANNRLLMFARKPAPVQVSWLAYPGTTGLAAIDYRLTDPYLDPPGLFDAFYVEKSLRLPETFWCYDPLTDQPAVNALPATANGVITFGCLNTFYKINDDCLALWARVLRAVPQSRLLLHAPKGEPRERMLASLKQAGIAASRVEFADRQPRLDYFRLYHRIDISLDPLPWNGGATTLDAFWMGVPTLTLLGKTVAGRAGWSQLSNLGLQELAAQTTEQYMALAVRLAGDFPRLQELRSTLRQRMLRSPLMDGKRFARHVEQAYRRMWQRWCQQTKPAGAGSAISVDQPISRQGNEAATGSVRQTLNVAWRHYLQGQWQQAEQLYLDVLDVDPHQVDALHLLAVIAGQTGRDDRAVEYLREVLRLQPGLAAAHNNLGNAFAAQGRFPEAEASFREAVALQPDFAVGYNNLGNALREQGRLVEAVASLRQALHLKPDYAEAHQNLGIALQDEGKFALAQASFQQALRIEPDQAGANCNLGAALLWEGRLEEAVASYQQALRIKPDHAKAHLGIGSARKDQGRLDDALAAFRACAPVSPRGCQYP